MCSVDPARGCRGWPGTPPALLQTWEGAPWESGPGLVHKPLLRDGCVYIL